MAEIWSKNFITIGDNEYEVADCSARINPAGSQIDSAPNEVIGAVIRSVYGSYRFKIEMIVLKRMASAKGSQLTLQSMSNNLRCF